jgi:hypothetical protein
MIKMRTIRNKKIIKIPNKKNKKWMKIIKKKKINALFTEILLENLFIFLNYCL